MNLLKVLLAAAFVIFTFLSTVTAHDAKIGDLIISHPWSRATLPNAPVAGGYLTIVNNGGEADRLVSVSSPVSKMVEMHEMKMEGDVMKMRPLSDGIEIPAGGEVTLKPGGLHLMFMKPVNPLKEGETFEAELVFENAGTVSLMFVVEKMGTKMKMDHSNHSN